MRKKIIAGNWKMNNGPVSTAKYFEDFLPHILKNNLITENIKKNLLSVEFYVPAISLKSAADCLTSSELPIIIGAQNISNEIKGAFTGEISVPMLEEININSTIIGHSERRHIYKENDNDINKKIITSLNNNINVVFCVGETLDDKNNGMTIDVIKNQILIGLSTVTKIDKLVIAYEPVWAIGTGLTASSSDAQTVCSEIRKIISNLFGIDVANSLHILYGGSVKPENTSEILSQDDIDGLLVGGASLKYESFVSIIENAL